MKKKFKFLFEVPIGSNKGRNIKKEGEKMSAPISGINAYGGDLFSHAAATSHETATKAPQGDAKKNAAVKETDTVDISAGVKARIMKEKGESPEEIAKRLGVGVKTVESFLGSNSVPTETLARQMKQKGQSVIDIANRLNVDVKTVERYLGSVPSPVAHQARQMKEDGQSVNDIAKHLNVDVKTVDIYLGVPPAPVDEQAQKMKDEGETVVKIANNLHLDVKIVNLYLGNPPENHEDAKKVLPG